MPRSHLFNLIFATCAVGLLPLPTQAQFSKPLKLPSPVNIRPNTKLPQAPSNTPIGPHTRIEVNVYKIGTAPFWHTGTVIDGVEYYFQTNNRVESCAPRGMKMQHHRTIVRNVPGDLRHAKAVLASVKSRWHGTRYDLGKHNCNFFTDELLRSLGTSGLDKEYLDASGLAKGLRQVPGGAMAQELLVKDPRNAQIVPAAIEDARRGASLPNDTRKEAQRAGGTVAEKSKQAGGSASKAAKKARKKVLGF